MVFAISTGASTPEVRLDGGSRKIVGFYSASLLSSFGGAIGIPFLRKRPNHVADLKSGPLWREFVRSSVKSKSPFNWGNPRVVIDLDNNQRIVVDSQGRFIVLSKERLILEGWKGAVYELSGPNAIELVRETIRLDDRS